MNELWEFIKEQLIGPPQYAMPELPPSPVTDFEMFPGILDADPSTLKAFEAVRRRFPQEMKGVSLSNYPMATDPRSFSSTLGSTLMNTPLAQALYPPGAFEHIEVNPIMGMGVPRADQEQNIRHELQHIIQNRTRPVEQRMQEYKNIPYAKRPDEVMARAAAGNMPVTGPSNEEVLAANDIVAYLAKLFRGQ